MKKTLPQGTWLTVLDFPAATDEPTVIAKFAEGGINLLADQISIAPNPDGRKAGCIVSVSRKQVLDLVERAMHGLGMKFLIPDGRR